MASPLIPLMLWLATAMMCVAGDNYNKPTSAKVDERPFIVRLLMSARPWIGVGKGTKIVVEWTTVEKPTAHLEGDEFIFGLTFKAEF